MKLLYTRRQMEDEVQRRMREYEQERYQVDITNELYRRMAALETRMNKLENGEKWTKEERPC